MILPMIVEMNADHKAMLERDSTHVILPDGTKFFFLPYWYEERKDGEGYMMHRLGHLPENLVDFIGKLRDGEDEL